MKNQYFGDVNDYRKYGLLRAIQKVTGMKTLVAWMLTPDDGGTDGKFTEYLEQPVQWLKYDPALYLWLQHIIKTAVKRDVSLIEKSEILHDTNYFSDAVPDDGSARNHWLSNLIQASKNDDLIFLDPDNGLEVKSKQYGSRDSSKYLYRKELTTLWNSGKSVLIYQHFPREKRNEYIQSMLAILKKHTDGSIVEAFSTPHVLFLLALQPNKAYFRKEIAKSVETHWEGQINTWNLKSSLETNHTEITSSKMKIKSPSTGGKYCPECGHAFKGKSWEGIDAHWRARHEHIMPYQQAWKLIKENKYPK